MKKWTTYLLCYPVLLTILLSGCATNSHLVWEHQELHGQDQLVRDQEECRKIARQTLSDLEPLPAPLLFYRQQRRRPTLWLNDPFFYPQQINREQLYRSCMKAKGWSLVSKTKQLEEP
jgi:hypothetical protein